MAKISQTAADRLKRYIAEHGTDDRQAIIEYANALVSHYGQASGALACDMYEATAAAQGAAIQSAQTAPLPDYNEVAKAVNGTLKSSQAPNAIGRLVKRTGADTTLLNAQRDGAQFAWVPHGDTCAFCLALASRGWQYMSKKALKNGHAEHIHANCDCQYAVRFDKKSTVAGYNPEKYREIYENAEGSTSQEKINSLRQTLTEQQRTSHHVVGYGANARIVDKEYIKSQEYRKAFRGVTQSAEIDDKICKQARKILEDRSGTQYETLTLLDKDTGKIICIIDNPSEYDKINYSSRNSAVIAKAKEDGKKLFAIHNHPDGYPPTADDCISAGLRGYNGGLALGHNGKVYLYEPSSLNWSRARCEEFHQTISYQAQFLETSEKIINTWMEMMRAAGFKLKELN